MEPIKVKHLTSNVLNGKNLSRNKETVESFTAVINFSGRLITPVIARFYMGRSQNSTRIHCSIWIHGSGIESSGYGYAGGYGYHKASAALQSALDSAEIELNQPIDGRGDTAMTDTMIAIACYMYPEIKKTDVLIVRQ